MGQSEASASVWRYNHRMATEARYDVLKTRRAPTNPAHRDPTLTPEELAEFIDSLREDEVLSPTVDRDDFDPAYND